MININLKQKIILADKYKKTSWNFLTDKIFYGNRPAYYPRLINLFVTEKCNFACPMCHVKESRFKRAESGDLNFEALKRLIEESSAFKPSFQIIGGEPLLYSKIFELLELLNKSKMPSGLTTNGLLLEESAEKIINSGLDFLAVSLDGPDEETQYKRGYVKGSFEKIIRGIKKVLDLRGGKIFPNIRIATVVSPFNMNNFDKILDIAKDLGADQWSISHYFYYHNKIKEEQEAFGKRNGLGCSVWGDYTGNKKEFFDDSQIQIIKEKYSGILGKIKSGDNEGMKVSVQKDVNIEKYYKGFPLQKGSDCKSPYYQVFIRGNGDVEMCQGYILGNIEKESLKDIWNGEKSKHFWEVFKKTGIMPACFRCCAISRFKF